MALRLIWSERALGDLDRIAAHVAEDSPVHARQIVRRVQLRTRALKDAPRSGRRVPEYDGARELREVLVYSWRVFYEVKTEGLTILAIIHGARLLENAKPF